MTTDTMTETPVLMPDNYADLRVSSDDAQSPNAAMTTPLEALLAQASTSSAAAADLAYRCIRAAETPQAQADLNATIALLARAADICARTLGESHPAAGALRCHLGDLLLTKRQVEEARQQYEIVLAAHRPSVFGDSALIAHALSGLGDALRADRKYTAALICLRRALRRQSELHGAHPATAQTHTRLGALWFEQGRYDQARIHFQEALAIREATLGPRDPATAQSLHNLGVTLAALGDLRSARVCLAQALAIREDRLGRAHLATAQSLEALSRVLADLGDDESAQYCRERAAALYRAQASDQRTIRAAAAAKRQPQQRGGARWMHLFRRNV
ncbi:MAG: tetratricopeptide repeat protein [Roseiflexus sp.]|nr:tetratricopeptide repeat protein [Roseiflexus sp.]MCS7288874.1 tetratricopeptide repeat protein [Roseiflexus sp.]MDW8144834.1 tetratricopeptide repeat protein [Roseiflexaceae bacterium]MDW8232257.1 tetratricopeptide repeat protein [Roseiflexaceae bacterium]